MKVKTHSYWPQLRHLPGRWWKELFTWFVPGACLLCAGDSRTSPLCEPCTASLPRSAIDQCDACALPLPPGASGRCGACLQARLPYGRATAPLAYSGEVAWLVRRFKFSGDLVAGHALARCVATLLAARDGFTLPQLLVPVPLHDGRLRERGFDQSVELARDLGRCFGVDSLPALRRVRATTPQTHATDVESRRRNIRGAFTARPELVSGVRVCVVDDVMTTGSTVVEAARALRAAGAAEVDVWCCARTARPR